MILHLFCSVGWSAMHVTVFPLRLSEAATVRLKFPAPLLLLLSAGKDSWAGGVPPDHKQRYCRLTLFTDCTEHAGLADGLSVQREMIRHEVNQAVCTVIHLWVHIYIYYLGKHAPTALLKTLK